MIRAKVDPKVIFDIANEYGLDVLHSDTDYTSLAFNDVKFQIATHMFMGERVRFSRHVINSIAERVAAQHVEDYKENLRTLLGCKNNDD